MKRTVTMTGTPSKQELYIEGLDKEYNHGNDRFLKAAVLLDETRVSWSKTIEAIEDGIEHLYTDVVFPEMEFEPGKSYRFSVLMYYSDGNGDLYTVRIPYDGYGTFVCKEDVV